MTDLPPGWVEVIVGGKPLWRHTSGAQVYESSFWKSQDMGAPWKAQPVQDVPDGDDDGYLYESRADAMEAALEGSQRFFDE